MKVTLIVATLFAAFAAAAPAAVAEPAEIDARQTRKSTIL